MFRNPVFQLRTHTDTSPGSSTLRNQARWLQSKQSKIPPCHATTSINPKQYIPGPASHPTPPLGRHPEASGYRASPSPRASSSSPVHPAVGHRSSQLALLHKHVQHSNSLQRHYHPFNKPLSHQYRNNRARFSNQQPQPQRPTPPHQQAPNPPPSPPTSPNSQTAPPITTTTPRPTPKPPPHPPQQPAPPPHPHHHLPQRVQPPQPRPKNKPTAPSTTSQAKQKWSSPSPKTASSPSKTKKATAGGLPNAKIQVPAAGRRVPTSRKSRSLHHQRHRLRREPRCHPR